MQWFAIKLKKIIWVAFLPKKNWYKIFPQKSFESILRLYATVTLRKKKTRKILCIYVRSCFKKTWKASFGAHFRPHLAQNYKTGFLQLKVARVNVKPAWYCNLKSSDCQFYKTWETCWAYLGLNKNFLKNPAVIFKFCDMLHWGKKSENCYKRF